MRSSPSLPSQFPGRPLQTPLFRPGSNCWGTPLAHRLSILIDAQEYYRTLLTSLRRARSSIVVLGWDVDTRLVLTPDAPCPSERVTLEEALRLALESNPGLVIHILCWDFAMLYSLERQFLPKFRRIFHHPRVHFALDGTHPFGASHHQKVVVIDDELAFTGGLDLCVRRWDTRHHRAYDPRRRDSSQRGYHPFHDVQAVLDGEAARWLGRLARARWERATGQRILPAPPPVPSGPGAPDPWPTGLRPRFLQVPVALARTQPLQEGIAPIREVEQLFEDSLRRARHAVYIEQQYFTSTRMAEIIAQRLREPDCPELLIVVPEVNSGWIEQRSMGVLRDRIVRDLREHDRRGRLRILYPVVNANSRRPVPISLHSKVLVADDTILRLGSANFSNRSMGLDTECDLSIEREPGSEGSRAIAAIRDSLLAEHLGVSESLVALTVARTGSLFAAVDRHRGRDRALLPFRVTTPGWVDAITPSASVLDPSEPVDRDPYFARFFPMGREGLVRRSCEAFGARMLASLAAALAWAAWDRSRDRSAGTSAELRLEPRGSVAAHGSAVALGALSGVNSELLIFGAALRGGAPRGAVASALGLLGTLGAAYAVGATRPPPPRDVGRPRPGGFLPSYLIHASMATTVPAAGFEAGRMRAPFAQTVLGAWTGQGARIASLAVHAALFRRFVRKPGAIGAAALAASGAIRWLAFRWLLHRIFPLRKRPSRPT